MPAPLKRRKAVVVNDREIPRRHFLLAGSGFLVLFGGTVWANVSDAQKDTGAADRYEGVAPFPSVSTGTRRPYVRRARSGLPAAVWT